jgi:protoporphyrinogen oxidase
MRLAQMAGVTLRSDVQEVVLEGSSVVARWRDESGHAHGARFNAAIIATQLAPAMRIAPDLAGRLGDLARQITRLSLLSVTLAFERQTRSRAYAVPLSSADFPDQLLMFLQHNKAPDRAPPGKSLVTFYIDHQAAERWFELTDGEIERRSLAFALPLLPELKESFLFSQITRWPQAGSLAGPGYYRVVREIVARLEPDLRLQLAGDFYAAGSMETAVRSGRRAAERLMAQVSRNS